MSKMEGQHFIAVIEALLNIRQKLISKKWLSDRNIVKLNYSDGGGGKGSEYWVSI